MTREEAGLAESFRRYLSPTLLENEIRPALQELLTTELGEGVSFQFEKMTTEETTLTLEKLPPQGAFLILGLPPTAERAIVEFDLPLAFSMTDHLLGGGGAVPHFLRPLTEIEQGVFSYLVLKLLSRFHDRTGRSPRGHFRLYEIQSSSEGLSSLLKTDSRSLVIMVHVTVGDRTGYCRFVFPASFIRHACAEPVKDTTETGRQFYLDQMKRFPFIKTDLWAEVGRTTVKAKELETLCPGDVVLLEETAAAYRDGKIEGRLTLRVGQGEHLEYPCEVVDSDRKLRVKLETTV